MSERNPLNIENQVDGQGNPTGGSVHSIGLHIDWQNGPLGRDWKTATPNGTFVDDVIEAARQRIEFYQKAASGKFACRENAITITKLDEALLWLQSRRDSREKRGVQGTHQA